MIIYFCGLNSIVLNIFFLWTNNFLITVHIYILFFCLYLIIKIKKWDGFIILLCFIILFWVINVRIFKSLQSILWKSGDKKS